MNSLSMMETQFDQDTFWNPVLLPLPSLELIDFEGGHVRSLYDTDFLVCRLIFTCKKN